MEYILGSGSPRRKELLAALGISFRIQKAEGEEKRVGDTPAQIVENLSRQKAMEVAQEYCENISKEGVCIIGADTLVAKENAILGKPKDEEDAMKMLELLSGTNHQVYTGVTVVCVVDGEKTAFSFHEKTEVFFSQMESEERKEYVYGKTSMLGNWRDKAGGYGIQEPFGMRYIKRIEGDYNNVVGLPVARLYQELSVRGFL